MDIENISKKYNLTPSVIRLLLNRGVDSEEKLQGFLYPDDSFFYDPFLLKNMDKLVLRVNKAIKNNEKVLIFGDYDVDGVSATAILIRYFSSKNFYVDYYLPNRYVDGYGLTKETLKNIFDRFHPNLIITVDCGISCYEEVEYAKTLGIDVIVTDHHDIPEKIPDTIVVNAKLKGQKYPFKYLCGTGVAFKVVQALSNLNEAKKYLGIAAIATISDIVPLKDENRAIVKLGLKNLENTLPLGLKMLFNENKLSLTNPSSTDIAFKLSPKINAPGRMGDANVALKLYIKNDRAVLQNLISSLNDLNLERQALCNKVYKDAKKKLANINIANYLAIVLYSKSWDSGILGIVAAKIANEFNKPTILFSEVQDELKGSARSVGDIDIFSAISSQKEVLEAFGGHKMAAGLTIKKAKFNDFLSNLNNFLSKNYSLKDFLPEEKYDMTVSLNDITEKFVRDLEVLEPCGCENPKPIFNFLIDKSATFSIMPKHPNHITINNIGFNLVAFNSVKYLNNLKNSIKKEVKLELQDSVYKNRHTIKGIVKSISTGELLCPKTNDYFYGNYLKQLGYKDAKARNVVGFTDFDLENIKKRAKEEYFGTLFVCYDYKTYEKFVKESRDLNLQHFLYEVVSNTGINGIVLAPNTINNFSTFKRIVFLDSVLSKNFLGNISKTTSIYIPKKKSFPKDIFEGLKTDRETFKKYFKIFSEICSLHTSYISELSLFRDVVAKDRRANYKQFIFCLYVFLELNIFSIEYDMEFLTLVENDKVVSNLNNSKFYNNVSFILKTNP